MGQLGFVRVRIPVDRIRDLARSVLEKVAKLPEIGADTAVLKEEPVVHLKALLWVWFVVGGLGFRFCRSERAVFHLEALRRMCLVKTGISPMERAGLVQVGHLARLTSRVERGLVLVSEVNEDVARLKNLDWLIGKGRRAVVDEWGGKE